MVAGGNGMNENYVKRQTLADKLDEIERTEVLQSVIDDLASVDFMKALRVDPLTEEEICVIDWLVHNDGETLEYMERCQNRRGWKISSKELLRILQSLILKRWVIEKDGRYFVDERTYL
jgi:hypothetical protein